MVAASCRGRKATLSAMRLHPHGMGIHTGNVDTRIGRLHDGTERMALNGRCEGIGWLDGIAIVSTENVLSRQ